MATPLVFDLITRDKSSDVVDKVGRNFQKLGKDLGKSGTRHGKGYGSAFTASAGGSMRGSGGIGNVIGRASRNAADDGGRRSGRMFGGTFVRSSAGPLRAMGGVFTKSLAPVAVGLAAIGGIKVFSGFIADARESAKVSALTASTIKATGGAAKVTEKQVSRLAAALSNKTGKDDEAIQSGQNMLLTFKSIRNEAGRGNDIFNQTSSVLVDMTAAMNGGNVTQENMRKSAIQLGKAMNDPIKGIGALRRVGIQFTESQTKQITKMVEAGNIMGAQKIILKELQSQFGGAAAATSSASDRMRVALGNMGEDIGTLLIPVIDKFARFVSDWVVPGVQGLIDLLARADFTAEFGRAFGVAEDSGFVDFLFDARQKVIDLGREIRQFIDDFKGNKGFGGEVRQSVEGFGESLVDVGAKARNLAADLKPVADHLGRIIAEADKTTALAGFTASAGAAATVGKRLGAATLGVSLAMQQLDEWVKSGTGAAQVFRDVMQAIWLGLLDFVGQVHQLFVSVAKGILQSIKWIADAGSHLPGDLGKRFKESAEQIQGYMNGLDRGVDAFTKKRREFEIKADIADAEHKLARVEKELKNPELTKERRAKLTADRSKQIQIIEAGLRQLGSEQLIKWRIARLGADKKDLDRKLATARTQLADRNLTKERRAQLNADIRKLIANKNRAQRAIDSLRGKVVATNITFRTNAQRLAYDLRHQGLAGGGPVQNLSGMGRRSYDTEPAMLRVDEHVWTPEEVDGAGGHRAMYRMRALARAGKLRGYADGGQVARAVAPVSPARDEFVRDYSRSYARRLAKVVEKLGILGFNAGLTGALNFARRQAGKPYIWGGYGPRGFDCSGFQSAVTNVAKGRYPYSRQFATGSFPNREFARGYGSYSIGSFRGNPGHMAGTINGVNVESRGGAGVVIGRAARGARSSLFGGNVWHLRGFHKGGRIPPHAHYQHAPRHWRRMLATGWFGVPGDRSEALFPPWRVVWGQTSPHMWRHLISKGWRGRPGDRMEAIYRPRSQRFNRYAGHFAAGGHVEGRHGDAAFDYLDPRGKATLSKGYRDLLAARGVLKVMDRGGWLQPGFNAVYNGTGRPERVPNPTVGADDMVTARALRRALDGMTLVIDDRGRGTLMAREADRLRRGG